MIEVRFGTGARARLWEGSELPRLEGALVASHTVNAKRSDVPKGKDLAIEVAIPRGGVISYGLLGGAFKGRPGDSLSVLVLSDGGQAFDNALAHAPENPLFGLPVEYATSVIDGFVAAKDRIGDVPSGSLSFNRAVHGVVGSSHVIFRSLAACVTRLVLEDPTSWDAMVQQELDLSV